MENRIILGLGSNQGNRLNHINSAIRMLTDEKVIFNTTTSSTLKTEAQLPPNAPKEWNCEYLNIGLAGFTKLSPFEVLKKIKFIEMALGRTSSKRWAPRIIDIDIILYNSAIIDEANLKIPHPELINRPWILKHIAELTPEWKHPIKNEYFMRTAQEILSLKS